MVKLTQSFVKRIENYCPRYVQAERRKEFTPEPNINLIMGNYFEERALGSTMTGESFEIPRLQSGERSAVHQRIDKQVEKFKRMFDPSSHSFCGYNIIEVQAERNYNDTTIHIDMVLEKDSVIHLGDLKLTSNIYNDFGSFGWGKIVPSEDEDFVNVIKETGELDLLQSAVYPDVWNNLYGHLPNFHYIVFDYSTDMNVAWFEIEPSETFIESSRIRFQEAETAILQYELLDEYPRIPSPNSCRLCPLSCDKRSIEYGVKYNKLKL